MHAAAVPYTYPGCRRALPCSYSWEYAATTGMDAGSQHADAEACVGCFTHALCDFLNWPFAGCTNSCKVFSFQLSVRLCGGGCTPPPSPTFHRCWVVVSGKADEVVWLFQPQHFYFVLELGSYIIHNILHSARFTGSNGTAINANNYLLCTLHSMSLYVRKYSTVCKNTETF